EGRQESMLVQAVAWLLLAAVLVVVVRSQLASGGASATRSRGMAVLAAMATNTPFDQPPVGAVLGGSVNAFEALYGPPQSGSTQADGMATHRAVIDGRTVLAV